MDVLVKIEQFSGDSTNQSYSVTNTDVRAVIIPASNENVALYEQMPQGQLYEFQIVSDTIKNLKQQSRITVTDKQASDFEDNDILITMTNTKRTRINGKFYLIGICYKKES